MCSFETSIQAIKEGQIVTSSGDVQTVAEWTAERCELFFDTCWHHPTQTGIIGSRGPKRASCRLAGQEEICKGNLLHILLQRIYQDPSMMDTEDTATEKLSKPGASSDHARGALRRKSRRKRCHAASSTGHVPRTPTPLNKRLRASNKALSNLQVSATKMKMGRHHGVTEGT